MRCIRCGEVLGPHSDELTCDDCRSAFYNGYFWGIITGAVIFLKDEIEWWADDVEPCRATVIGVDYPPSNQKKFTGDSLFECMAQVRVWKAQQQ